MSPFSSLSPFSSIQLFPAPGIEYTTRMHLRPALALALVSLAALSFGCEKKQETPPKPDTNASSPKAESKAIDDFPKQEASAWVNGEPRSLRGRVALVEAWHYT